MTLRVVPEGLTAASAAVEALSARLATAHATAAPLITAVIPPAADAVSVQASLSCSATGNSHAIAAVSGVAELSRASAGVAQTGASYAVGDAQASATYAGQGVG